MAAADTGGIDWGNLLQGGLGAYGQFTGAQNQQGTSNAAQAGYGMARDAYNPTMFNMSGAGGSGFSVSSPTNGGPGSISTSLGNMQPGFNNNMNVSNMFANYGANQMNNPLIGQAQGAAGGLINSAAGGASGAYNNALQSIMGQLGVSQGQTMQANNDAQFQRGQMGTTGGALQTRAMAQGFGLADMNAITAAQNQGLNFFNSNINNAGSLNNMALGVQGMGNNIANSGIGNFNNTANSMIGAQNQMGQLPLQYSQLFGNQQTNATNSLANMLRGGNNAQAPQTGYGTMASNIGSGMPGGGGPYGGVSSLINSGLGFAKTLFGGGGGGGGNPGAGMGQPGDLSGYGGLDTSGFQQPDMTGLTGTGNYDEYLQGLGFNSAGGEAATQGGTVDPLVSQGYASNNPMYGAGGAANGSNPNSIGGGISSASNILGMMNGMNRGGAAGMVQAGLNAGALGNRYGAFTGGNGASQGVGNGLGTAGGVMSMINGIKQGGIQGYGGALAGGLQAGSGVAGMAGNAALQGGLSSAAGYVAAPLALYNAVKNWQSGNTGSDTLQGAEAGAAIGSIVPGVGTLIGGLVGGGIGALSSAFGGGKTSGEATMSRGIDKTLAGASDAQRAQAIGGMAPAQAFQMVNGYMNAHDSSPGHSEQIQQVFGKNGVGNMFSQMMPAINSAMSKNPALKNLTPTQLYSQVVAPWLKSKGATIDPNQRDVKGNPEGKNLIDAITGVVGQWQGGNITGNTQLGIGGQTMSGLPSFGGNSALKAVAPSMGGSNSSTGQMFRGAMARSRMTGGGRLA